MAKNEFLPFGIAEGANVLSNQEYERLTARFNGFVSGVAKSKELNTVWRQSSVMSSVLAQFIVDSDNKDLLDNGDIAGIKNRLVAAIKQTISGVGYVTTSAMNLELNKKMDKANISGVKGNDNDKVPSLNLFTTEIGKLASIGYSYSKIESDGRYQPKGEYATSQALNDGLSKKFDIANISQAVGPSPNHVMSQDASTKTFQPKGDYLKVGMFGFGGEAVGFNGGEFNGITATGVYKGSGDGAPGNELSWGSILHLQRQEGRATQLGFWKGIIGSRSQINSVWDDWIYAYSEANTTKDPSGFVRAFGSAIALTTNNVIQGTGSSTTNIMSQKAITDSLIGIGQTWENVTLQRKFGVTYTNTNSKPIFVSITQNSSGTTTSMDVKINGVLMARPSTASGATRNCAYFIVPVGGSYLIDNTGTTSIEVWAEMK